MEPTDPAIDDRPARLSLIYGTKAQFIKMVPIIWELEKRGIPHRLIDTGQHQSISSELHREYGIRPPDCNLGRRFVNVNSISRGAAWLAANLCRYAIRGGRTRETLFSGLRGVALVHGDTASTVLAALIAKRAGQKVMHIEAGLRSWRFLNPFPEELIRIVVMRMSDYLLAPSSQAYENLRAMSLKGRAWEIGDNTIVDDIAADLDRQQPQPIEAREPYCVFTIHRMETLYSRRRIEAVVASALKAQEKAQVLFVQHPPTARRLAVYQELEHLERAGVRMLGLLDHSGFVHLLNGAEFVVTDGGSVQEEASYLGVPCLLMRVATERDQGMNTNVVLSEMSSDRIDSFMENYRQYRGRRAEFDKIRPSAEIVDILMSELAYDPRSSPDGSAVASLDRRRSSE